MYCVCVIVIEPKTNNGFSHFKGCPLYSKDSIYSAFIERLHSELITTFKSSATLQFYGEYCTIMNRMEQSNLFTEIFKDEAKQKNLLPLLHHFGTNLVLKAEKEYKDNVLHFTCSNMSIIVAITAIFCQHNFDSDQVFANKIARKQFRDLNQFGLEFDACRYYKKNLSCQCLTMAYVRLKALPKLGECQTCRAKLPRSKLFLCGRCKFSHYCSVRCQAAEYPDHMMFCSIRGADPTK